MLNFFFSMSEANICNYYSNTVAVISVWKKLNEQSDRPASDGFSPGTRAFENAVAGESRLLVDT